MHTHKNRLIAGILAAAMIVPLTAGSAELLPASAYELLGETSFDYKLVPWIPAATSPARQDFEIQDGAAHITVIIPNGETRSKWDLQFRHRGLSFKAGHQYQVSFKAKAKRCDMELDSYIGTVGGGKRFFLIDGTSDGDAMHMGPDMGGNWGSPVKLTTEFRKFSGLFTPTDDIDGAEWAFWYANDSNGYGGNAIEGDELWFDDMSIEDLTDPDYVPPVSSYGYTSRSLSGLENNYISVNQLGYFPGLAKTAVLADNQGDLYSGKESISLEGSYDYEIVRAFDDTVVNTGKTGNAMYDADSGDTVCKIDFTGFDQIGEYYLRIKGKEWRSFPFRIDTDIYSQSDRNLLTNVLNSFYQNRAGCDIEARFITSGEPSELAHAANPDESVGIIMTKWHDEKMSAESVKNYGTSRMDAGGGWFTGMEYDKNMTEGGISLWMLQNLYERASQTAAGKAKFADGSGTVVIPETNNAVPDILDECRYELDFMAKLKVQPDEDTWGEFAGLYYNNLKGVDFRPNMPAYDHEYHSAYAVQPPTFAATLHYAACAAQGARLWMPYDEEYAAELLQSAKDAYEAFKHHYYPADMTTTIHPYYGAECPKEETDPMSLYAPFYAADGWGDTDVMDEAYWAVCELFISAKAMGEADADTYLQDITKLDYHAKDAFKIPETVSDGWINHNSAAYTVMNCINTAAAGSFSLALHKDMLSDEQAKTLEDSLIAAADSYAETVNESAYGSSYKRDPDYSQPTGLSYTPIEGYAFDSNGMAVSNMIAMAYAYDLTGDAKYLNGAATGMNYLLGSNPMAFSFITGYGSYHTENPANRYWQHELDAGLPKAPDGVLVSGPNAFLQDPYVRALGFVPGKEGNPSQRCYADSVESWATNSAMLSDNAALAWVVSFMQDETAPAASDVPGDVDGSGKADAGDIDALLNYLLKNGRIKVPAAADLNKDGKVTSADLTLLKRSLLKSAVPTS